MDEFTIRAIAREEADKLYSQSQTVNQFGVSQSAFHTHNGIDSQKFPFQNLSNVPNSFYGKAGLPMVVDSTETLLQLSALSVSGGGTGKTTWTPYAVVIGGTAATSALQQVSGVGTSGQVLTSSGSGAAPVWSAQRAGQAYGGLVNLDGTSAPAFPSGWTTSGHGSTGVYTVDHYLNTLNYGVSVSPISGNRVASVTSKGINSFDVQVVNFSNTLIDAAFYFVLVQNT